MRKASRRSLREADVEQRTPAAFPGQRAVPEEGPGGLQLRRDDHWGLGQGVNARRRLDPDAQLAGPQHHPVDDARPAPGDVPHRRGTRSRDAQEEVPDEGRREPAGVGVVGDDAHEVRRGPRRRRTVPRGGPGEEVLVDRGAPPTVRDHREQTRRWRPAELTVAVEPDPACVGPGQRRCTADEVALDEPAPVRPVGVEDMRAVVGDPGSGGGTGASAGSGVGLVHHDVRAGLGAGDRRRQPRQARPRRW